MCRVLRAGGGSRRRALITGLQPAKEEKNNMKAYHLHVPWLRCNGDVACQTPLRIKAVSSCNTLRCLKHAVHCSPQTSQPLFDCILPFAKIHLPDKIVSYYFIAQGAHGSRETKPQVLSPVQPHPLMVVSVYGSRRTKSEATRSPFLLPKEVLFFSPPSRLQTAQESL